MYFQYTFYNQKAAIEQNNTKLRQLIKITTILMRNFLNRISGNKADTIISVMYSMGKQVSVLLFGYGTFRLLADDLSKYDYGIWVSFLVIVNVLEVSRTGLLKNPVIKYLNDSDPEDYAVIVGTSWYLNFFSLAITVAFLLLADYLNLKFEFSTPEEMHTLFLYYIPSTVLLTFFLHFEIIQHAKQEFNGIFWSYFARQGSFFLCVVYFYIIDYKGNVFLYIVNSYTFSIGIGLLISLLFVRKHKPFSFKGNMKWVKRLWTFGKYTFAVNLSAIILRATDLLMLKKMVGPDAAGEYQVTLRVSNLVEMPSLTIAEVFLPKSITKMVKEGKDGVRDMYEQTVGVLFAVMFPIVLVVVLFSDLVLDILAPSKYGDLGNILRITTTYALIMPFLRQWANATDSLGKPHWNFWVVFASMVFNFGANYVLILHFEVYGAAFATLLTFLATLFANQFILKRAIGVSSKNIFGHTMRFYRSLFRKVLGKVKR